MKWAFVDYENVGNLNKIILSNYDKVIVFVGAKQNTINFGDDIYTKPIEITYIKISEIRKNNLDLHLAYYLSHYNQIANNDVSFEIISNDKAFLPLIDHINVNGRKCTYIGWESKASTAASKQKVTKKKKPHLINNIIYMPTTVRPRKKASLINHIKNVMSITHNIELEVQRYIQELVEEGIIDIDNEMVKYHC